MVYELAPLTVKVWGPWACFTRPEMKVERVSYPVPTASAARGILEAVFWRPEFSWEIREIWVLHPIRYASILRNEVKRKIAMRSVQNWAKEGGHYDIGQDRTQRHTLALRDVAYVIKAQALIKPQCSDDPAKYRDQFRRRLQRGQCFSRPYLGCREFAASFGPIDGSERPLALTEELGRMLLDLDYSTDGSGRGSPRFFEARLEEGILRFPHYVRMEV